MIKDITKELLYLIAVYQIKSKYRITVNDLKYLGLSIEDLLEYSQLISENKRYYHLHVTYNLIGLNLLIYKRSNNNEQY